MAFARVEDMKAERTDGIEDALDWLDRRPGQRQIVTHLIDVTSGTAEIRLHVDDEEDGVLRTQIAIVRPGIGIGFDVACVHVPVRQRVMHLSSRSDVSNAPRTGLTSGRLRALPVAPTKEPG